MGDERLEWRLLTIFLFSRETVKQPCPFNRDVGKVDGSPGISLGGQAELRCLLEPHPRPGEALSFVAEGVPIESEWWAPGEQALGRQLAQPPPLSFACGPEEDARALGRGGLSSY